MDFVGLDVEARVARWFVRPAFCLGRYQISGVIGPNVYAYVLQNPWTKWDPEGLWCGVDDFCAMGIGALVGVAVQGASDLYHHKVSSWTDYAAAGVGGAAAGEAAIYTGGLASGAVGGAAANLTRQGLKNWTGEQKGFDATSLATETAFGAAGGKLGETLAPILSRTAARALQTGRAAGAEAGEAAAEATTSPKPAPSEPPTASAQETVAQSQSQTPTVQANKAAGDAVRDQIAAQEGGVIEKNFRVTGGLRRSDVFVDGVEKTAIESKVGRTGLTTRTRQELARDAKILRSGQADKIRWQFSPSQVTGKSGPTGPLRSKINKLGFELRE